MTDLTEQFNISLNHPGEDDLTAMRANWFFLQMAIGGVGIRDGFAGLFIPGWTTTITTADTGSPLDYSEPTEVLIAKTYTDTSPNVLRQFKYVLTWTGGFLTQVVYWNYDATGSPQWQVVTGGTITITRDATGNMTGATSA
jgi:hypothetical protein